MIHKRKIITTTAGGDIELNYDLLPELKLIQEHTGKTDKELAEMSGVSLQSFRNRIKYDAPTTLKFIAELLAAYKGNVTISINLPEK